MVLGPLKLIDPITVYFQSHFARSPLNRPAASTRIINFEWKVSETIAKSILNLQLALNKEFLQINVNLLLEMAKTH